MHIGIIMDGNGRWAAARGKNRNAGHREGAKNVDSIARAASSMGVKILSLYAFSTENWKRPESEVAGLFDLLRRFMRDRRKDAMKNNIVFRCMGDLTKIPADLRSEIESLTAETENNSGLILNVAINYGGRDEIVRAGRELSDKGDDFSEQNLSACLYTNGLPDPDLIIRTGGQLRLSNFMLWQSAYAELYFTDTLWPDFDGESLKEAIEDYNGRKRNFGGLS